jgi:hypothetical protein
MQEMDNNQTRLSETIRELIDIDKTKLQRFSNKKKMKKKSRER